MEIEKELMVAQKYYSEKSFFDKLKRFAGKIGQYLVHKALVLYYVALDSETPTFAKTLIFGALGYLIFPMDAIPDIIPGIGYSDDLTAIVTLFTTLFKYVSPYHIEKANKLIDKYFK